MLLGDHMRRTGEGLFRWRSYVLLVFVPFIALTLTNGEAIEEMRSLGFHERTEKLLPVVRGYVPRRVDDE